MAANDTLYIGWELRGNVEEQIKKATGDVEKLQKQLESLGIDKSQFDIGKNIAKNAEVAAKALYKLYEMREKAESALSKGMRMDVDTSGVERALSKVEELIYTLRNLSSAASGSKDFVKNFLNENDLGLLQKSLNKSIKDMGKEMNTPVRIFEGREGDANRLQQLLTEMDAVKNKIQELRREEARGVFNPRDMQIQEERLRALQTEYDRIATSMRNMQEASRIYGGLGHIQNYKGPEKALSDADWAAAKSAAAREEYERALANALEKRAQAEAKAAEAAARAEAKAAAQKSKGIQSVRSNWQASAERTQEIRKEAEALVRLRTEMLKTQAVQLQGIIKNGKGVFDSTQLDQYRAALREIIREISTLKGVMSNMKGFSIGELNAFGAGLRGTTHAGMVSHAQQVLDTSRAVNVLTESERRFVESINSAASPLRQHGVLLSDLQTMATQYLSLWGAQSFLRNIIETGGLLEQQRLSIGAILGSMDKANNIFSQIKALAIKSPFGVVELDKMSKQLTAYGFEYNELFDWTKRLADISAATGTEVSRLALALGHVRAEGALSGYTLRQFAMGNIPLLEKLSERLNITKKEVREKTKKKEISYDDVMAVMRELTDEGGMFYNAQEIMSQALNAKFKNLRDAFDIMYGEIAESGIGDMLKGIAETLTAGAKEWRRFGTDILWVASAFGTAKIAAMAYTTGMTVMRRELGILAVNSKAFSAQEVQNMLINRQITREQLLRAVATGRLTVEQAKLAAATMHVSEAQLVEVATSKTVNKALLGNAIATSRLSMAELRHLAAMKAAIGVGRTYNSVFAALYTTSIGLGRAINVASAAFKRFLPFLAIGAVVDFFSRISQQAEAAKEQATDTASTLFATFSELDSAYKGLMQKPPKTADDLANAVERMSEALKESGNYSSIQSQVEGTQNLNEQYSILFNKLQDVSEQYSDLKLKAEQYLEIANKTGGTWFTDNMKEDINDLSENVLKKNIAKARADKYASIFRQAFEARLKTEKKWVESSMRGMDWSQLGEIVNIHPVYSELNSKYGSTGDKTYREAAEALLEYQRALNGVKSAQEEVSQQMPEAADAFKQILKDLSEVRGLDFSKILEWSDSDIKTLYNQIDQLFSSYNVPEEVKKRLIDDFLKTFPKEVRVKISGIIGKDTEDNLEGWRKEMNDYFKRNKIAIGITADTSIEDVEKQLKSKRDELQKKMDAAGGIFTRWHIKPDLSAVEALIKKQPLLASFFGDLLKDYNESKSGIDKIDEAGKRYGFNTVSEKKSGGKKNTGRGSTKDKELERVRNNVELYKKFYSELEKARNEYGAGALDYLRENGFETVFGWELDDVEDYKGSIETLIKSITGSGKKLTEERRKFIEQARSDEFAEKRRDDTEVLRDYANELKRMMSIVADNYQVYEKWLKLTGNASLAASIAGVAEGTSYADYLREQMNNELNRRGSNLDADYVFGLKDISELKKEFGENSTIKILWEAWRKNTEDLRKENEKMLQEAVKGAKSYEEQMVDVNNELQRQLKIFDTLDDKNLAAVLSKNARENADKKISNIRWERFKNENDWGRVFGDLDRMPLDTIRKMIKAMNEFDVTALKDIKDTKEWYNALRRLTDKEAVLDPIGGITSAAKQYMEAMDELNMSKAERKSRGLPELTDKRREQLEDTIASLLVTIQKSLKALASSMNNLSSTLQSLGSSIGGKTGNFFNALGTIFGAYGKSMDALSSVDLNAKGVTAVMQKVGAVAAIVGTMIDMNKKLSELLPSQEKAYEHYARKAREVNKLREAVDDYARSVARAQAEEDTWFGGNDLTKLRAEGARMRTELKAYYNELYEPQVAYKNKGAGWSKWAVPIATGIAAVAGVVATALTGGAAGVAILGAMATLEGMVGTVAATAIGTAVAAGIGAAAGQAINAGIEQFTYGNGQVAARQNLLMQTRHRSFWRSEKTENLEDWVRKNLNAELFDSETGLVDLKAAEQVLEKYGDKLVGDTRATLERLVEIRKEYDEFIKNIEDYVGEIGDNLASNMTDAIWDWLADGKNALDSFKEYAGDTFKQVAQDIMSTFLSVTVLDDFKEKFKNLWLLYSTGQIDEQELAQQTAMLAGQMAKAYNATLPMAQNLATIMKDAFGTEGIDIVGDRNTSSDRNVIRGDFTEEETGLLLSYVNAIRGDCSANRMTLLQILTVVQGNGELSVIAQSQLRQLEAIAANTGATASNTARISEIYDILHENVLGGNQFNIA